MKKIVFNKKILMTLVLIFLLIVVSNVIYYQNRKIQKLKEAINTSKNEAPTLQIETGAPKSPTAEPVPENIKVPEKGEAVPEGVAAPNVVTEAAPGVQSKFRSFDIKAENNKFNPSTVIVKLGDTVHINFSAIDKDYDITFPDYGMKQTALKGQTKVLEFQAVMEGKFTYYCEMCGGLDSTAKGYIIVAK